MNEILISIVPIGTMSYHHSNTIAILYIVVRYATFT